MEKIKKWEEELESFYISNQDEFRYAHEFSRLKNLFKKAKSDKERIKIFEEVINMVMAEVELVGKKEERIEELLKELIDQREHYLSAALNLRQLNKVIKEKGLEEELN